MPAKYDVAGIINFLQEQPDISPDDYDGSYELLRETVKSYAAIRDYAAIDYQDMNVLYLMVIGTWKHGIDKKKETINASHLPDAEKTRILSVIDRIWTRVCAKEYSHLEDADQPQMGMFGTGFYTFKGKTTDQCAKDFVHMCVDILTMEDEDAIFERAEQVLTHNFRGMKAASASVVLHCLKPEVFPILNGNMGTDNIFEAAGVKLKKRMEVTTYITNCRVIRAFRDKNFDFRNYRVFDVAQWKLDQFRIESNKQAHIDQAKLKKEIDAYKKDFQRVVKEENYKWEAVKCFKDNFKIDAEDFPVMLERALEKSENLLTRINYFAKGVILDIAHHDPEYTRIMFQNLFDESEPVLNRMKQFEDDAEIYSSFGKGKNTFQGANTSSVFLFFNNPEKYYIYLSMKFEYCARQLGYENIPKVGSMERVQAYFEMADQIWEYAKTDPELIQMNRSRLTQSCYEDPQNHILAEDLVYFINWRYKTANKSKEDKAYEGYWPSIDDYDPSLTAAQYEAVFSDKAVPKDWLDTLYYLYKMGGEGTCKQIAAKYGNSYGHYNSNATAVAKKVHAATDCSLFIDEDGRERYWPVLFVGKDTAGDEGSWIWKLRTPVKEAIKAMEEKDGFEFNKNLVDYPKNIILYGPPGTGKTYHTVLYAVSIIEGRNLDDVMAEDYSDVKARYNEYAAKDQIAFTTFHQSYGYEEFIEGIKPLMDESTEDGSDVKYVVERGVFKRFCEQAMTPVQASHAAGDDFGFNKTPVVWKVSLDGTGDNPVREECLENGHIRIGWDSYGEQITDETDFSVDRGKVVLNAFINKMRIGDVVLSCYSASTIDAIGVVTSEYEWHPEYDRLRRLRKVKWLAKGLRYNIVEMNGGSTMTLATVYKLNVSMADVLRILEEAAPKSKNQKPGYVPNQERYVFIIDEINRGNISKVFGELITLIESSKRIGQPEELRLLLPYSKKSFGVPNNVYIIGTMNTADRSIALMDTALRRRFHFIEMQPAPDVLAEIDVEGINISEMLRIMNKRIEILCDREHTIGHSYFIPLKDTPTMDCLAGIFKNSIVPLLQEYFFDDYEKIRLVLADNQKPEGLQFITRLAVDITSLFGNTDEDIDVEVNYLIHDEVFKKKPEAYIGIYS